jgi:hypothetical protein
LPGIDAGAPDRTETRSGFAVSPNFAPVCASTAASAASTSAASASGYRPSPCAITWRQTSVVIVNPGGTGSPSAAISARLAPLPPSRFLSRARPSAVPPPNE